VRAFFLVGLLVFSFFSFLFFSFFSFFLFYSNYFVCFVPGVITLQINKLLF